MKYGADYLGGRHYQRAVLKTHPKGWVGGIFLTTFGPAHETVRAFARSGLFSELVIHIAPFDKSHRYPIDDLKPQVLEGARFCETISRQYPDLVVMPSPFCEHNHSSREMKPLFDEMAQVAPSCLLINSIWKGEAVPNIITEIHIESRSRLPKKPRGEYQVAFDGFGGDGTGDFTDTDVQEILHHYTDARHIRLWNFRYNGKFGHKDTSAVDQRKHWPGPKYLRGHNAMMKNREGSVTWPNAALYKPFADDHGEGGKDNKAMAILPGVDRPSVEVFDSKGKRIGSMARVLPDHANDPKGPRFYSDKYAFQLANMAQRNTGSRKIKIHNMPLTDGDLRSGRFK